MGLAFVGIGRVKSIALNDSQQRALSQGRQHSSSITRFAGLLALILFNASCQFAFGAYPTLTTLATADTGVLVEARDDRLKLLALKSIRSGWNWATGNELRLISAVEVNGKSTPLHWKFKMHIGPKGKQGQPAQEIFVFENE